MRAFVRSLMVSAVVSFAACGGGSSAPSTGATPSSAATQPASSSQAGAEFGVAECDTYMKLYVACIDRMPEAARAQARQALDQTKASWKQAASTDQGRAALAATCKAASDAAAPAMRAQGCSW
jgi:hypothetical protein